jgi:hypothetical protein
MRAPAERPLRWMHLDVTPHSCLVWTNEEGGDGGQVTTITFEQLDEFLLTLASC